MNYVVFDEIKCLSTFTKHTTKVYNKATIYINELILTPFSPFDITVNAKYFMWKTSGNVFLGHLGGWVFYIFPTVHLIIRGVGGDPRYILEFLWIMSHYSISPLRNIKDGAKGLKLLLTVVTLSFILNVTGLLDRTLKYINKFRLRQYSFSICHYMLKVSKKHTRTTCQIYLKL